MPIRIGTDRAKANRVEEPSDGEALYDVLALEITAMPMSEQLALVTALQASTSWASLAPALRDRLQNVAEAFLG